MKKLFFIPLLFSVIAGCGKEKSPPEADPTITFADAAVSEGNSGAVRIPVKVELSKPAPRQITLKWSTQNATAVAGEDFKSVSNASLTIEKGASSGNIEVEIVGDDIKEGDEFFTVVLSNPENVALLKAAAKITLLNDDTKIGFNNEGFVSPDSYPGYTLAWSDEFNSPMLNTGDWTFETGDGCPNLCGWGNNELQAYSSSPTTLFFQEGKMIIEARKQNLNGKEYSSARIKTADKKAFKYGRIDIRAILPKTQGIWPAFWMLPEENVYGNWPKSGEIDIMEMRGSTPSQVLGTLHYGPGPGSIYQNRITNLANGTFNDQFHVFSLEWEEDKITWLLDGEAFGSISKSEIGNNQYPFNEEFYMLINLAVGGNFGGNPDETTVLPQWLIVDYIRVFQK